MYGEREKAAAINAVLMHYIKSLAQTRSLMMYNAQGEIRLVRKAFHLLSLPHSGLMWKLNIAF